MRFFTELRSVCWLQSWRGDDRSIDFLWQSLTKSGGNTMTDKEKIIQVKTLEDFDRELDRDGDETLEVPAWMAGAYGVFPEDVGSEEEIRDAVQDRYTDEW